VMMSEEQALEDYAQVLRYIVRMLCAGLIHGDLSEFNILVDPDGPVIIDLPQAVDASANNNARAMLLRDVQRVTDYYGLFAPAVLDTRYGEEIWQLFEDGELTPEHNLTGLFADPEHAADVDSVMLEIRAALREEEERLQRLREEEDD